MPSNCFHVWNKNGRTSAGLQRWRCKLCGASNQEPSLRSRGQPKKYNNSRDRFKSENRKMYSYKFRRFQSYTSYPGLSASTAEAIAASNYDEFPEYAIVDGKKFGLQPHDWSREPNTITQAGYAVWKERSFTLKVRVQTLSKSPDYDKPNGNGDCLDEMIVRCDRPVEFKS